MIFDNFEIHSSPFFKNVYCPKHRNKMVELENGWFNVVWYCKECQYPYELKIVKMRSYDKKALQELLNNQNNVIK